MSPDAPPRQIDVRLDGKEWDFDEAAAGDLVRQVLERTETALGPLNPGNLEVWFATDAQIRDLNQRFRQQDKPTNVLSFEAAHMPGLPTREFGQLALAGGVCAREAAAAGLTLEAHVRHLLVHGLLHVQGHDHQDDAQAHEMQALESQVMAAMGLDDPYAPAPMRGQNHG